ncbi:MAG: hypothetical protein NVSMB31_11360 [Vulcanimicrobiaceae bacterium]
MNRRRFVIGSAAATGVGVALVAEGCSTMKSIAPLFPGAAGYTLNVGYATTTFGAYTLRTRTYNGSTAGPTLEAFPGGTLRVTVNNQLPPNPPAVIPQHGIMVPHYDSMQDMMRRRPSRTVLSVPPVDPMNNPHSFNTTNLHVHGIQTIPHLYEPIGTSNPGAMMIAIEPGQQYTYNFPIPADHPSGLFWYHPHHHGSTDVQVAGGMAGLIVVRGPIDQVPEIAAAREILMAIQTLEVNQIGNTNNYEYEPVAYQAATSANPNAYTGGTAFTMLTVNGQGVVWMNNNAPSSTPPAGSPALNQISTPQITMQPGEVIRLRLLNGTNGIYLPLLLPGMDCYVIAYDGINLPAPVKKKFDFSGTVTQLNLSAPATNVLSTAPGNRVELLIQAPATPGTYTLSVAPQSGIEGPLGRFNIANFVVTGTPVSMSIPAALPLPTREYPLITQSETVRTRTIYFHESVSQPAGFNAVLTGFWVWIAGDTFPGQLFNEMTNNFPLALGTAEEWILINQTTCGHPFHIHVNSFEVIAVNGVDLPVPQFQDTFMIPPAQAPMGSSVDGLTPQGSIKIRMRFKQWTGKAVFHCHILQHEDTGMMQNIIIS